MSTSDRRVPSSSASLPAEQRYQVQSELGRGAMGVVYRARDRLSGRDVALKVLSAAKAGQRQLERFRREGEIVAGLDHPGIVRVFSADRFQGRPCLVYALVPGARPLGAAFAEAGLDQRLEWVAQAAEAIGHAHARGVVHRDLKPDNVLVGEDGRARVTDFGVGLRADAERLTRTGALVGTPHYMAPEQLKGGEVGPRSDVFALGVILYEALSGRLPFDAESLPQLFAKVVKGAYPRLPEVDPALAEVLEVALATDPARRYPDGACFARALRGGARVAPATQRSRGALLPGLALACALGLGLGGWLLSAGGGQAGSAPAATGTLQLDPLPEVVYDERLTVAGRASVGVDAVQVTAGSLQRVAPVNEGRFQVRLRLPAGAARVRVEAAGCAPVEHALRVLLPPAWYAATPAASRPALPLPGLEFGEAGEYLNPSDGSVLVWVTPGRVVLGGEDEFLGGQVEAVDVDGLFVGKYEVTRAQWLRYAEATGASPLWDLLLATEHDYAEVVPAAENAGEVAESFRLGPQHPVLYPTPLEADAYCAWAGLRLPTEAEWERAARGDDGRRFPWGDAPELGRFNQESDRDGYAYAAPVGSFPRGVSPFGCHDMAGNAAEVTGSPFVGQDGVVRRAVRGGSYLAVPFVCQSGYRDGTPDDTRSAVRGFRVARSAN